MANDTGYLVRNTAQPDQPPELEVFYPATTAKIVKLSDDPLDERTLVDLEAQVREIAANFAAGCEAIAAAITSMGVPTAADAPLRTLAVRIRMIRTPLSGNTDPADVLSGRQFYSRDPDQIQTGTMPDWRGLRTAITDARLRDGVLEILPAAGCHGADYSSCLYITQSLLANLIGLTAEMLLTDNTVLGVRGSVDPVEIYQAGYDAGVEDTKKLFCIIDCTEQVHRLDLTDGLSFRAYTDSLLVTQPPAQLQGISDTVGRLLLQDDLALRELFKEV